MLAGPGDLIKNFNLIQTARGGERVSLMSGYELLIIIEKQCLKVPQYFNYFLSKSGLNLPSRQLKVPKSLYGYPSAFKID